ncbi:MAG: nucleotidyltransferase domain-containing protein [Chitinivibrionales bacterium]|nr:nucleotidyltransferase domain-containing protein [Chitinivibrionales bacterium]
MNTFGISEKSYSLIQSTLAHFEEIEVAVIFGSRAKGNFRNGSDIDLALKGKECTPRTALDVSGKLNESLPIPYRVDVLDYNSIQHQQLKEHIDRMGIIFYTKATATTG